MSVCVLGSINRDLICRVDALPRPGETVTARETLSLPGGKGANQAVAAARMGARVAMVGAVGDDAAGAALTAFLAGEGIDTRGVARCADVATGTAYIAAARDGENQIIVDPGANARVAADTAAAALPAAARVLLAQLETPVAATATAFAAARAAGVLTILNTAPALDEAAALFPLADVLVLNQTEAARYLGLAAPPSDAAGARAVRRLLTRDGQRAVVTLGAGGALLLTGGDEERLVPARDVAVVDTTGAGDCFCGALAALLAEGMAASDALPLANAAAALCVGQAGAAPAMPTRAAVAAAQRNGRGGSRSHGAPA